MASQAPAKEELYNYTPSLVGAIVMIVAFFLTSSYHAFQLTKTKTWYFIPLLIGILMEIIGYVARVISHHDIFSLPPYIVQALLLLIAPALYAASIYMILGRLITILDAAHLALIRPTWLTKIFVAGDVLSFAMQSTGGAMLAQKSSNAKMGKYAILAGLFAQIIFFNLFMIVTIIFHRRLNKAPTHASQVGTHWKKLLAALYAASLLILVRSVFRVVEYQQGREGYLLRKEVWLYLFDAVLMFFVGVIFNVVHPSIAVPGRKKSVEDGYALRSADGN